MDANVLLDVATADPRWAAWPVGQLDAAALRGSPVISDIAYAEVSMGYARVEDAGAVLAVSGIEIHAIPRAGLFLAGKAFRTYRACGGAHTGVLHDFLTGPHASVAGLLLLLMRDVARCCTCLPAITLIVP